MDDRTRLHRKANIELDKNLVKGEIVRVVIEGTNAQAVIGTDRRVFVYKKGFMAGASFGSEMTSWDYRNIVGIQLHTGMMSGAVVVQAPGQSGVSTNYWKNKDSDPHKAPNAIPISRPWDQASRGVARLRELIDISRRVTVPAAVAAPLVLADPLDQLRKLGELRDSGILTQDEFEERKATILSKM